MTDKGKTILFVPLKVGGNLKSIFWCKVMLLLFTVPVIAIFVHYFFLILFNFLRFCVPVHLALFIYYILNNDNFSASEKNKCLINP